MIKFLRKIRQQLLTENRIGKYLLYALGEIVLVMIGILLALQVSDWNEHRKNQIEQYFLLNKLESDIQSDVAEISMKISRGEHSIANFIFCLEVLSRKKEVSRSEFMTRLGSILGINFFDQNTTTFDNLVSSGKIELIEDQELLDSLVAYYNKDYKAWDTANRDYTRNILAPYIMSYDHVPQMSGAHGNDDPATGLAESEAGKNFYTADVSLFDVKPKSVEEYRQDLFIINALRSKIFNLEGQLFVYLELREEMQGMISMIKREKERLHAKQPSL
jgi:hypothetical protein